LRECGEIAALRLSSALSDALSQVADNLFMEATTALTHHEREAFVDAADFARQHRNGMVFDFMKHFEHRYMRNCQRRPNSLMGHSIDFDAKELKVVEHHLLDESLEPGKISEAIQNSSWKNLQLLTSLFRELLDCQDLMPSDLPLGPKVVEAAVSDAIRDQPWRHKAKHRLVNALRWVLAARVNLLYQDLVDLMSARDLRGFSTPGEETSKADKEPPPAAGAAPLQPAETTRSPAPGPAVVAPGARQMDEMQRAQAAASEAAQREVARSLLAATLPLAVEEFLSRHWRDHLARIHVSLGPDSTAWRDAVRTMDDLVWSLTSKSAQEDYARLKEGLPGLLKRLQQGMDVLALPLSTRDSFLVLLVKHLGDIVQEYEARHPITQATVVPLLYPLTPAPAMTAQSQPSLMAPPQPRPGLQPPPGNQAPPPDLEELKVGAWLEFREPGGQTKELRLAWISPHRNLFLLTNREGERVLSLKAENLAKRLKEGHAWITQQAQTPQMDESVAHGKPSKKTA
jgi:hypothetical protein